MAVSSQQQALVRKFIYTALIVALFTISLIHRRFVVEPQGNGLLLREVSQGEVKLTDSAVRLALTGSRGIAVTFLWSAALEKQKRHEWNELDLLVSSITRLQPHFITPWLFQSWNLAFNVAVECDRPRDKYFYISRGLEVLAEGERRNYKPPAPGNPDMRQNMGFYYQVKMGTSDEKNTMRCLLEMSCIDPLERAPERLWVDTDRGKEVKLDKFKEFCTQNPRLVRRLHDQLKITSPKDIILFLEENKDIPSRFEPPSGGPQQRESVVKEELDQFPILPPGRPNPKSREISSTELVDVYFVSRNWFEYAQKPLAEPNPDLAVDRPPPNPLVYRMPRYIAVQIFRGYPARAQAYIAENLEAEGWFDADGWAIKKWFDKERGPNDPEYRVGTGPKFYAGPSWDTAYRMYLEYGTRNGLYLTPLEVAELQQAAQAYRKAFNKPEGEVGPAVRPDKAEWINFLSDKSAVEKMPAAEKARFLFWKGYHAHHRLIYTGLYQNMTQFLQFLTQTDAERTQEAVNARKFLYNAERYRQAYDPERAIPLYQKAWQLWAQVLLAHPDFAELMNIQDDLYEAQHNFNMYVQKNRTEEFKKLLLGMAQFATWPHPPIEEVLKLKPSELIKIMPVRSQRGLLDSLLYYDGPNADLLKTALTGFTQGAVQGMHLVYPALVHFQLTRPIARNDDRPERWGPPTEGATTFGLAGSAFGEGPFVVAPTLVPGRAYHWRTFVDQDTINRVRNRLGLDRAERLEKK